MKQTNHRQWFLLTILLIVMIFLTGCAVGTPSAVSPVATSEAVSSTSAPAASPSATVTLPTFNADQLAAYDGKDGHSAYIAVDGKVYDVTNVAQWKNGSHAGKFQAGADYTEALKSAPHSPALLDEAPVVGIYQP